jgi:transcriptional regulator with XRE-family HTH domain
LSQERLAETLGVDWSTVARWERGEVEPHPWARLALAQALALTAGELASLLAEGDPGTTQTPAPAPSSALALSAMQDGAWQTMTEVQRRNFLVKALGVMALPSLGLDELRHIARALENAGRYLDAEVIAHFREQIALCAADDGLRGPKETLPAVLGLIGAIEQSARDVKPHLRRELFAVGAQSAEFAGWLYRDIGLPEMAGYWRDRAIEWAQVAGDSAMQGYILLKKSQAAWDQRDAVRMLTLAQACQDPSWHLPAHVRGEAAPQEARGHAMLGDDFSLVESKLDEARELLSESEPAGTGAISTHYGPPLLAMQTAICYAEAGQSQRAVAIYDEALTPDAFSRRDYGYFLTLKSGALAQASAPDLAARTGLDALSVATSTHSLRSMQELLRVVDRLAPWAERPAVRELQEAMAV